MEGALATPRSGSVRQRRQDGSSQSRGGGKRSLPPLSRMTKEDYVTSYAGAFQRPAEKGFSDGAAGVLKKEGFEKIGEILAPGGDFGRGGCFGDEEGLTAYEHAFRHPAAVADELKPLQHPPKPLARPPPGLPGELQAPPVRRPPQAPPITTTMAAIPLPSTHDRCIAHENGEAWRDTLATSYEQSLGIQPNWEPAQLKKVLLSSRKARVRSRQEAEGRWRSWQQKQHRRAASGAGGEAMTVTEMASTVSMMPAGQRVCKSMGQVFLGGIRLPLFGQDFPEPALTTLAGAPWADRLGDRVRGHTPRRDPAHVAPWAPEQVKHDRQVLSARG
eukprot:TRINITY_DN27691_c0_g1_i1.p1 TRINITY_DN27691_c0_g1~~TRINITY_DN27691_c0_g1_i1.p1  ORF type:complete len:331 (+),score=62.14 TRINITY_DN27691_c0_g1_i1:81-1073(+)